MKSALKGLFLLATVAVLCGLSGDDLVFAACPGDKDCDGVVNSIDNCPNTYNPSQSDADGDESGDACDVCTDPDEDGLGNPGLPNPGCADDNCPAVYNPEQTDTEADGVGDACDNCPGVQNPTQVNADMDVLGDACDDWTICSWIAGPPSQRLPNPDYVNPAIQLPPAKGLSYLDLAFGPGCSIKRLTDGFTNLGTGVRHEYSNFEPFNLDSTRILVEKASDPNGHYFMVIDRNGGIVRSSQQLQVNATPRWSVLDPNVFYYRDGSKLYAYSLLTGLRTIVRDFAIPQPPEQPFGYASIEVEGDTGPGDSLVIASGVNAHKYTVGGQVGPRMQVEQPAGPDPVIGADFACGLTPSTGRILCRLSNAGLSDTMELFAADGTYLGMMLPFAGHDSSAVDSMGNEFLVVMNDSLAPCVPGVVRYPIQPAAAGAGLCLVNFEHAAPGGGPWGGGTKSVHISAPNKPNAHPWVLVSTSHFTDQTNVTSSTTTFTPPPNPPDTREFEPYFPPNGTWQGLWGAYFNEIILVRLDGTQMHRLAHHRSRNDRVSAGGFYWSLPRAALSRDGVYALFDSNFNTGTYTDVYMIRTKLGEDPPPQCGPCVVSYCIVGERCENTSCGPGGCCAYTCFPDPSCELEDEIPPHCGGE